MAAKFRKIDPRIWHDEAFAKLNMEDRLIALYCLSSSQTNRIGLFHLSPGMASEQLRIDVDTYRIGIRRVCDTLGWVIDSNVNVVYMPTWWKYNGRCGPKTISGLLSDLHDVPKTPLLQQFMNNREYLTEAESKVFDTYDKGMPRVSAFVAQEQEQEQEKEQEQEVVILQENDLEKSIELFSRASGLIPPPDPAARAILARSAILAHTALSLHWWEESIGAVKNCSPSDKFAYFLTTCRERARSLHDVDFDAVSKSVRVPRSFYQKAADAAKSANGSGRAPPNDPDELVDREKLIKVVE